MKKKIIIILNLILLGSSLVFAQQDTCEIWLLDYQVEHIDSIQATKIKASLINECFCIYPRLMAYPGEIPISYKAWHFVPEEAIAAPLNLFGSQYFDIQHHEIHLSDTFDLTHSNLYFKSEEQIKLLQIDSFETILSDDDQIVYDSITNTLNVDISLPWNEARLLYFNGTQFFDHMDIRRDVDQGTFKVKLEPFYQLACKNFEDKLQFVLINNTDKSEVLFYKPGKP